MGIDIPTFRNAMGLFPGAVTLITTGSGDLRRGITATAVCSVSDSPPSLLVCVNRKTGTCAEILRSGRFSVQLLDQTQTEVALQFAGATGKSGAEKFALGGWDSCPFGLPRLRGALASLSCAVLATTETGSHCIFVGGIDDAALAPGDALVYARSKFHRLKAVA
ncbi:flavin reductase family protein [Phaeovulum sp. W22_SRMD_FR3]|uniref:flavin reductase family protein n=1 Tax=Phaeovulum sp. W22_SRMD_FR3 TaxID=3240274 RepID=UPI003F96339F